MTLLTNTKSKCKLSVGIRQRIAYIFLHDKTLYHKQLKALWESGKSKIDSRLHSGILRRLDHLDAATSVDDMNLPGFDFHQLNGLNPTRFTVHINGPWCVTFEFENGDAYMVDFEQYH